MAAQETLGGLSIATNSRERLVQLVGHRGSKLAHRGDSSDVGELCPLPRRFELSFSAVSDVVFGADPFADRAVGRNDRHGLNVKMPIAPITSTNLKLVLVHALLRDGLLPQSLAALLVLGVKRLKPAKVVRFIFTLPRELLPAR